MKPHLNDLMCQVKSEVHPENKEEKGKLKTDIISLCSKDLSGSGMKEGLKEETGGRKVSSQHS